MKRKIIFWIIIVGIFLVIAIIYFNNSKKNESEKILKEICNGTLLELRDKNPREFLFIYEQVKFNKTE